MPRDEGANPKLQPVRQTPWYDDGDVVVEVHDRDRTRAPAQFRLHRAVLALHSEAFRDRARPRAPEGVAPAPDRWVVYDEVVDDFALLLRAIYADDDCGLNLSTADRLLERCERYGCRRLLRPFRQFCQQLPSSYDLLQVAFGLRLDTQLCCRLASWALIDPQAFRRQPFMMTGRQPWKLALMQLAAVVELVPCSDCRQSLVEAIGDGRWDGNLFNRERRCPHADRHLTNEIVVPIRAMFPLGPYLHLQ